MDWMTRLGGRKFIMAMIAGGFASYLETTQKGLSPTMAGFLVALVGAFSAANYASTARFLDHKSDQMDASDAQDNSEMQTKIDQIHQAAVNSSNPEQAQQFMQVLQGINDGLMKVQSTSLQLGQGMISISKKLDQR